MFFQSCLFHQIVFLSIVVWLVSWVFFVSWLIVTLVIKQPTKACRPRCQTSLTHCLDDCRVHVTNKWWPTCSSCSCPRLYNNDERHHRRCQGIAREKAVLRMWAKTKLLRKISWSGCSLSVTALSMSISDRARDGGRREDNGAFFLNSNKVY